MNQRGTRYLSDVVVVVSAAARGMADAITVLLVRFT